MESSKNPVIVDYVPFIVKRVVKSVGIPKDETELIEFSQELSKLVIKKVEPISKN